MRAYKFMYTTTVSKPEGMGHWSHEHHALVNSQTWPGSWVCAQGLEQTARKHTVQSTTKPSTTTVQPQFMIVLYCIPPQCKHILSSICTLKLMKFIEAVFTYTVYSSHTAQATSVHVHHVQLIFKVTTTHSSEVLEGVWAGLAHGGHQTNSS